MLVLSRKPGQDIQLTGAITIRVVKVVGDKVTLAFDAPAEVRVWRGELEQFEAGDVTIEVDSPALVA